jgi:hypothetical protein
MEHMHQLAARIETCTSRITNKAIKPLNLSKTKAIQNCQEIMGKIELSQQNAKWVFKKENLEVVLVL